MWRDMDRSVQAMVAGAAVFFGFILYSSGLGVLGSTGFQAVTGLAVVLGAAWHWNWIDMDSLGGTASTGYDPENDPFDKIDRLCRKEWRHFKAFAYKGEAVHEGSPWVKFKDKGWKKMYGVVGKPKNGKFYQRVIWNLTDDEMFKRNNVLQEERTDPFFDVYNWAGVVDFDEDSDRRPARATVELE